MKAKKIDRDNNAIQDIKKVLDSCIRFYIEAYGNCGLFANANTSKVNRINGSSEL